MLKDAPASITEILVEVPRGTCDSKHNFIAPDNRRLVSLAGLIKLFYQQRLQLAKWASKDKAGVKRSSPSKPGASDDEDSQPSTPLPSQHGSHDNSTPPPSVPSVVNKIKTTPRNVLVRHLSSSLRSLSSDSPPAQRQQPSLVAFPRTPAFKEVAARDRTALFVQKVDHCCVVMSFTPEPTATQAQALALKRATLLELVDYLARNRTACAKEIYEPCFRLFASNAFRTPPPSPLPAWVEYDPEEDEPVLESTWPHLEVVYEFMLRFVEHTDFNTAVAKPYITQEFLNQLVALFDGDDPRERDMLKTLTHRLYGKLVSMRPVMRRIINHRFLRFLYEDDRCNGVAELLEILGSIINGFASPIKEEHKAFLFNVLIPLHRARHVSAYHAQLCYCIIQFIEKDSSLATPIITNMLKYWPKTNSHKEVLYLNELEELLDALEPVSFPGVMVPVFTRVAACVGSPHFQVAERALSFWTNPYIQSLMTEHCDELLPILFTPLFRSSQRHWHRVVHAMVVSALRVFAEAQPDLFHTLTEDFLADQASASSAQRDEARELAWQRIEDMARQNPLYTQLARTNRLRTTPPVPCAHGEGVVARATPSSPGGDAITDITAAMEIMSMDVDGSVISPGQVPRRKSILPISAEIASALQGYDPQALGTTNENDTL